MENLYFDVEFATGGRVAEGTAVRYGDKAAYRLPGGVYFDTIRPGALTVDDVVMNAGHDRKKPLLRTGNGLTFDDSPDRLRVRAEFTEPLTGDQRDALLNLKNRLFRSWSLEIGITDYVMDQDARTRVITKANVTGIALVDRPGFKGSEAVLKEFEDAAYAEPFSGKFKYNVAETISDDPGRAVVRKRMFRPGAFNNTINDPDSEIGLLTSRNPNDAVASKRSGTLMLEQDGESLTVSASNVADTAAWRDLLAKRDAGLALALQPIIKADSGDYEDVAESPGDGTALIRTYAQVKLLGFMVTARPLKGASSEVDLWLSQVGLTVY